MASYKSDPSLCFRATDVLHEVLAKEIGVELLCTTIACPFQYPCIILPLSWLVTQNEPCPLDQDLLTMKGSSLALARIIQYPQKLGPVYRKHLCDQGTGSKVHSQAIIMVKN